MKRKKCCRCKRTKPARYFSARREVKSGLSSWCSLCKSEHKKIVTYGMTDEQYQTLLEAQGGACKICGVVKKLHIDHDHKSNKVRGLLCGSCNRGLGLLKDSPQAFVMLRNIWRIHEIFGIRKCRYEILVS